jgi:UDP-N-acetyl-D-mannosaminuronic acid transferase (WecB/TagA/CpsF family)
LTSSVLCGVPSAAAGVPGEPSAWATNAAKIFLQPFGLANPDSTVSAVGTNGDILQATRAKLQSGFPVNVACNNSRWVSHKQTAAVLQAPPVFGTVLNEE